MVGLRLPLLLGAGRRGGASCSVASYLSPSSLAVIAAAIQRGGVHVSVRAGAIRVSCHVYNTAEDVKVFCRLLRDATATAAAAASQKGSARRGSSSSSRGLTGTSTPTDTANGDTSSPPPSFLSKL